jgi:hypothetical protein
MSQEDTQISELTNSTGGKVAIVLILIWFLAGIVALIMSVVCFGLSGSVGEKVIGLLIAFFLGPLYFIFYGVNKGYCRNLGANVINTVNTGVAKVMGGRK